MEGQTAMVRGPQESQEYSQDMGQDWPGTSRNTAARRWAKIWPDQQKPRKSRGEMYQDRPDQHSKKLS